MNMDMLRPKLDYLRFKSLGEKSWHRLSGMKLHCQTITPHYSSGNLPWRIARWLEGNSGAPEHVGCYATNCWRGNRRVGDLPALSTDESIHQLTSDEKQQAKRHRILGYMPLDCVDKLLEQLTTRPVVCSMYVSTSWYDPPEGTIPDDVYERLGTHSVALIPKPKSKHRVFFKNDIWGNDWGDNGVGNVSTNYLRANVTEMSLLTDLACNFPLHGTGLVAYAWKWSFSKDLSFHCREIVDADTDERIAWAFCSKRDKLLEVHEFFVWPTLRGNGYARELARMVLELSDEMGLTPRTKVSFADSSENSLPRVEAVAKLLGLNIQQPDSPYSYLEGVKGPVKSHSNVLRKLPPPAASILEMCRPLTEEPIDKDIDIPLLFGTNRLVQGEVVTDKRGTSLSYGATKINVSKFQRSGRIGSKWMLHAPVFFDWVWTNIPSNPTSQLQLLTHDKFVESVKLRNGEQSKHVVFVHGFCTTFEDASVQAARLCGELKLRGNMFLFSWPSAGSYVKYDADQATVEASQKYFDEFLAVAKQAVGDEPLSVIGHSMGNRFLARWIAAQNKKPAPDFKLQNIVFLAPDVDFDEFSQSVSQCERVCEKATLYANRADLALKFSESKHNYARAGLVPPVAVAKGLDSIVVEGFKLLDIAHSYFAGASNTLDDIFHLVHYQADPSARRFIRKAHNADQPHWILTNAHTQT